MAGYIGLKAMWCLSLAILGGVLCIMALPLVKPGGALLLVALLGVPFSTAF